MLPGMLALKGFSPDTPVAVRRRVVAVLVLAVLGISSSSVIVRGMEGIGPVAIAAWRCLGSAVLLSPGIALVWRGLSRRDLAWTGLAGAFLGAHFAVWFASLQYTTVMRSTVLVALVPVWTGLLEWIWHGERPQGRFWIGVALALPGVALLTGGEWSGGALTGDLLAVFGGLLWAVYFLIGRDVRQRVQIAGYMGLVCAGAAIGLFPAASLWGEPLVGYPTWTWLLLLAAIAGPQLLGHQGSNYAVKYLPARVVSMAMLFEPLGATILAWAILAEEPPLVAALGALFVVAGVVVATSSGTQDQPG